MNNLLHGCKLSLPEGLKELMADISREVLRAQPQNLYQFIADYLSAMLVTRDNLIIAEHLCEDICECKCEPELSNELKAIGLVEDDVAVAKDIILKYFANGEVNEYNLMRKLAMSLPIDEESLPTLQEIIRTAFIRHQSRGTLDQILSDSVPDSVQSAVKHTLALYHKTRPSEEEKNAMAQRIQASYRAYGVRRDCSTEWKPLDAPVTSNIHSVGSNHDLTEREIELRPLFTHFKEDDNVSDDEIEHEDEDIMVSDNAKNFKIDTESSVCIAGSLMDLPKYMPYSIHTQELETILDRNEFMETEKKNIDYETARRSTDADIKIGEIEHKQNKIEELLDLEEEDDVSDDDVTVAST